MTIRNHPKRDEILDLICLTEPGEVRAQVGSLKIRYSLSMLRDRVKREFDLDLSVDAIIQLRREYGAARRDVEKIAVERLRDILT